MLDDVVNFIPARISAMLMILSCCFLGNEFDQKNAMKIFKRDRYQHASPNSAQTEAACAGALGIRLAGDASYFGRIVKKPYIGDPLRAVETEDTDVPTCRCMGWHFSDGEFVWLSGCA